MRKLLEQSLKLPVDVLIIPVNELSLKLRGQLQCEPSDFAVGRRHSRAHSSIIDADAARLLGLFRTERTVVDAVVEYCRSGSAEPSDVLEQAFPLLRGLIDRGLLVEANSPRVATIEFSLSVGSRVAGYEITRCVQLLEDTELYQVRDHDDKLFALKLMRGRAGRGLTGQFEREAAVLRHLAGTLAPALIGEGDIDGRRYLIIAWCPGVVASDAGDDLRRREPLGPKAKIVNLCGAILDIYAELHRAEVVHGDVHPRNILCADGMPPKLVDFGLAVFSAGPDGQTGTERAGVGFYFEPEYAIARGRGEKPPAATAAGEQYALAALVYLLLTGSHYLDLAIERAELFRQIAEEPPLPFSVRGVVAWPQVEEVLARALNKSPSHRYPSVGEFANAFRLACASTPFQESDAERTEILSPSAAGESLVNAMIERYGPAGSLLHKRLATDPFCSVNFGAAGIAYAFYRLAVLRESPTLLSIADLWSQRALRDSGDEWAFQSRDLELHEAVAGAVSLYHTVAGVHCVQALISESMGDANSANRAIRDFVRVSRNSCGNWDLTLGRSSTLIGAAGLLDAVRDDHRIDSSDLLALGNEALASVWSIFERFAAISECEQVRYLGIAHGWAGVLYAAMRWCKASGAAPPPSVELRLDQLLECAEPIGKGLIWKRKGGNAAHERMPWAGWCHGSAGYVHLFTLAHGIYGEARYLAAAEQAGWTTWHHSDGVSSNLCCGLAGQAYALLNLYKHVGDAAWLKGARKVGELAAADAASPRLRANSLFRGNIGIALLAADVMRPESACMPLFEAET